MKKILLAVNHTAVEKALTDNMPSGYSIAGIVTYKGGILPKLEELRPDILVLRKEINGHEDILDLAYEIRVQFPAVRIIFITYEEECESHTISMLASWGIFDIIASKKITLGKIIEMIQNPRTLRDMGKFNLKELPFKSPDTLKVPDRESTSTGKKGILGGILEKKTKKTSEIPIPDNTKTMEELSKHQRELEAAQEKKEALERSIAEKKELLQKVLEETEVLEKSLVDLGEKSRETFQKKEELISSQSAVQEEIEHLRHEVVKTSEALQKMEADRREIEEESRRLRELESGMDDVAPGKVLEDLREKIAQLETSQEEARSTLRHLERDIAHKEEELALLEEQVSSAQKQSSVLEGDLTRKKEELEMLLASRNGEGEALSRTFDRLNEELKIVNLVIEEKAKAVEDLEKESSKKETERDILIQKEADLLDSMARMRDEISDLETRLRAGEEEVRALDAIQQEKRTLLEESLHDRSSENDVLQRELEEISRQAAEIGEENAGLAREIEEIGEHLARQEEERIRLEEEKLRLKQELEQANKNARSLENENTRLASDLERAKETPRPASQEPSDFAVPEEEARKRTASLREKKTEKKKRRLFSRGSGDLEKTLLNSPKSPQTICFVGSKHGVGNSTIALNVAALLATRSKVLYLEVNDKFPLSTYLFELMNISTGLEHAADHAVRGNEAGVKEEILRSDSKTVPENLHFLTFSSSYLIREKNEGVEEMKPESLSVLLDLLYKQKEYDYILLDLQPDENDITGAVLPGSIYTNKVFLTLTQDVHSIGCTCYKNEQMQYGKDNLKDRTTYLINRFDAECKLGLKEIASWIEVPNPNILPVELDPVLLSDLGFEGKFYSLVPEEKSLFVPILNALPRA